METLPFTYLIKCIPTNEVYYGVRYCRNCSPNDLWTTYFTSSAYVRKLLKKYGKDSFLFEVRRVFSSANDALLWERKVLTRMKIYSDVRFINKNAGGLVQYRSRTWMNDGKVSKFIANDELEFYIKRGFTRGRMFTQEHQRKINSSVAKFREMNPGIWKGRGKGKKSSDETKSKLRKIRKGKTNPNAKQISINGITYPFMKDAVEQLGRSYWWCRTHAD